MTEKVTKAHSLICSSVLQLPFANYLPEKRSFEGNSEILRTTSQPRTLLADIPASQKGVYLFYNTPINFHTFEHALVDSSTGSMFSSAAGIFLSFLHAKVARERLVS